MPRKKKQKPIVAKEEFADLEFPTKGLDLTKEFETQREGTTPVGTNVRAIETFTDRERGGSRSGLSKLFDDQLDGTIQHLNMIVDPTTDAIGWLSSTEGDITDPSTSNKRRRIPVGQTRYLRRRGSGRQPNRNTPKTGLTITASDQTKSRGGLFTWNGLEFSQSGLEILDTISSVQFRSRGAAAAVKEGTYPIIASNAIGSAPGYSSLKAKYKINYVKGTMTVTPASIVFIQQRSSIIWTYTSPNSLAYSSNVTAGNLLVVIIAQNIASAPTVSDSQGNTYTQAGTYGTAGNLRMSVWYAKALSTGANTVSYTYGAGNYQALAILEYSGANASTPLDAASPGNTSYHSSLTAWTTDTIAGTHAARVAIAAFSQLADAGTAMTFTETAGFTVRVNNSTDQAGSKSAIFVTEKNSPATTAAATGTVSAPGAAYVDFAVTFKP